MTVIDLNEIYKIIYYKYILSFKVLDINGVKHRHIHLRPRAKNQGFRVNPLILLKQHKQLGKKSC